MQATFVQALKLLATAAAIAKLSVEYLSSFSVAALSLFFLYSSGSSGTASPTLPLGPPPIMIGIPAKAPFHSLASEYEVSLFPSLSDPAKEDAVLSLAASLMPDCWLCDTGSPAEEALSLNGFDTPSPAPAEEACECRASGDRDRLNGMPSRTLAYPERVESAALVCRESAPPPVPFANGLWGGSRIISSSALRVGVGAPSSPKWRFLLDADDAARESFSRACWSCCCANGPRLPLALVKMLKSLSLRVVTVLLSPGCCPKVGVCGRTGVLSAEEGMAIRTAEASSKGLSEFGEGELRVY